MAMLKRDDLTSVPAAAGDLNALLGRGSEFEGKLTFEGTVRIDGKIAPWIEEVHWHAKQKITRLPDGSLDLEAMVSREGRLTAEDIDEAFRAMLAGEVVRTVIRIGA